MADADILAAGDSGNTNPPEAYVYVITAGDEAVKVGVARATWRRLKELQTGHYKKLSIAHQIGFFALEEAYAIEHLAHKLLAAARLEGEWFRVSPEEAKAAIERAISKRRHEQFLRDEAERNAARAAEESLPHVYLGPEITQAPAWAFDANDVIRLILQEKEPKTEYLFNFGDCVIFVGCRKDEETGERHFFMNDVSCWHMQEEDGSPYDVSRSSRKNPLGNPPCALFATVFEALGGAA